MLTKVSKWGNSLGIRLPKSMLKDLNLRDGSEVLIVKESDRIIIEPKTQDLTIEELLQGMTKVGVMDQYEEVKPIGKEQYWKDDV